MTTTYHIADIRNIALAGHGASGKTTLADALLFTAGATERRGSVDEGTSISDVEDEEKRRHFTIDSHLLHLKWADKHIHLVNTRRIFQEATRLKLGRVVALTKMDADNVDFLRVLERIRAGFGSQCVPFFVPVGQGPKFTGVIDALNPPE